MSLLTRRIKGHRKVLTAHELRRIQQRKQGTTAPDRMEQRFNHYDELPWPSEGYALPPSTVDTVLVDDTPASFSSGDGGNFSGGGADSSWD